MKRTPGSLAPRLAAVPLAAALAVFLLVQQSAALNLLSDSFILLSARPLGMGGASCAVPQPASVFTNPAALACLRSFSVMHNHSARHFPGSQAGRGTEWDQLDGDTQAIIVPLPLGTYAHGFTLGGEMGYDFRNLPLPGTLSGDTDVDFTAACGYPLEQYWGTETYDSYAAGAWLPFCAGISHRRHLSRFTPDPAAAGGLSWLRFGEGQQWGILCHPLPGLSLGHSDLKIDYNFLILPGPAQVSPAAATGAPDFSQRERCQRSGWAFRPCGWLTIGADQVRETHRFVAENGSVPDKLTDTASHRSFSGMEMQVGSLGALRRGYFDGHPTVGWSLSLLGLCGGPVVNYAEAEGLLPTLVGSGRGFENVHIYGFDVPLI